MTSGMSELVPPFLERLTRQLDRSSGPAVIVAESAWGAPYLFAALAERATPLAWLKLEPEDEDDAVAQGNKLADALSRALGSPLFGHGMAYSYGLALLKQHLGLLEPITFALSNAEHGQELAAELARLTRPGTRVLLHFETVPTRFLIPEAALLLQAEELRLRPEEALELAAGRLGETEVHNLWRLSRGALEPFALSLHRRLSLPAPLRPGPVGAELPPGSEESVPPPVLLQVLVRREQWVEALELAVKYAPERVGELLERAGDAYLERGLYGRLYQLLEQLGSDDEAVLTWQLRAAKRLGRLEALRERVERTLAAREAPELRAIYATTLTGEASHREAFRAYRAAKTPVTLQHYGLSLSYLDPQAGLAVLRELLELARRHGPAKQVVAEMMLAPPLLLMGRYKEAAYWLEEALSHFDQHGLGDWQARMHIVHNWAYTRILIGETVGLAEILSKEAKALQDAYPALALGFRSTLGDYLLSQGRPREALPYYQENYEVLAARRLQGRDLPQSILRELVHALLHAGEWERAGYLAHKHAQLERDAPEPARSFARLSLGMVQALEDPAAAIEPLEAVCRTFAESLAGDHLASSSFYLARAHLALGDEAGAAAALARCQSALADLSDTGFRLLAGPEAQFHEVYRLWRGQGVPLKLQLLGEPQVTLHGEPLELFPQWHEILALLALHPEGLASERLLLELLGERGNMNTLKASISKLRRLVPISRAPYRLELPVQADVAELEQLLRQGRVRAGLERYRGPLLPRSQAPGVIRARETVEESLRQAVLASGDPEALLSLAERLGDDLELWEAALAALPRQDPRYSLASAKQKKVLESW